MTALKPIIGITGSAISELPLTTKLHDAFVASPAPYSQCVEHAGGIPLIIPPSTQDMGHLLDRLDGIVFSGGTDVHPAHYQGNESHSNLLPSDEVRDQSELALIKQAIDIPDLPILCICRGTQILNIALGGNLLEHLPDHIEDDIHRDENGLWTQHAISVQAGSKLAQAMQTTQITTVSGHHQALDKVAAPLTVTATASDGVVEAVELTSHPWCIAVQWHPERTGLYELSQQNLFAAFIAQAKKKR